MHCAPCLNGDRLAKPLIHVRQPLQIPHRRIYRRLRHLAARRTHSPHRTQSLRTLPRTHSRRLLNPARIRKLGIARRISNRTRPEYAVSHGGLLPAGYRRFPQKEMRQIVVYLRETASELVYQNVLELSQLHHRYEVIRLWEQPAEQFLEVPGLFPLASLSRTDDPLATLTTVSEKIAEIANRRVKANIAASTALLAGLRLKKEEIRRLLRSEMIQESVIYQEIWETALERGLQEGRQEGLQEGRQEGLQEGLQEGRQEGLQEGRQVAMREIAVQLLASGMEIAQVASMTGLSVEEVEKISDRAKKDE